MKRFLALLLVCIICLTSCGRNVTTKIKTEIDNTSSSIESDKENTEAKQETRDDMFMEAEPKYSRLSDPELLDYVEGNVYRELVSNLDSDEYFVENVSTSYVSKEYLEELSYNSKSNIFFGYTLADLDEQFEGTRYVFTLGEDGTTVVEEFEGYDDTYERTIKNVAIGTGVILVCVTVSAISAGAGAPAVSMIFAASAKSGTIMALSSGTLGGISAGIVTGIETKDFNEALKTGALEGSEAFKWGAISGAIAGGAEKAVALKGATLNGLTMNEAAQIQKESGYPLDVIKEFASMDQYEICKEAGLVPKMVNGKLSLVREIDLDFIGEDGLSNLERMRKGLAALDPDTGLSYELHHIGQRMDSTLAILTKEEHMQNGNNTIWHSFEEASKIDRPQFNIQKSEFWKTIAEMLSGGA